MSLLFTTHRFIYWMGRWTIQRWPTLVSTSIAHFDWMAKLIIGTFRRFPDSVFRDAAAGGHPTLFGGAGPWSEAAPRLVGSLEHYPPVAGRPGHRLDRCGFHGRLVLQRHHYLVLLLLLQFIPGECEIYLLPILHFWGYFFPNNFLNSRRCLGPSVRPSTGRTFLSAPKRLKRLIFGTVKRWIYHPALTTPMVLNGGSPYACSLPGWWSISSPWKAFSHRAKYVVPSRDSPHISYLIIRPSRTIKKLMPADSRLHVIADALENQQK